MGLNFRGAASRFTNKNQNSFQDKSAPGPRRGVGGDQPGSLARAEKRFGRITSPAKIKKNFYGGEAYFQDGYSGDLANSLPITRKSSSPLKMNQALVDGAADTGKKFLDHGASFAKGFNKSAKEPEAADLGKENKDGKDQDPGVNDPNANKKDDGANKKDDDVTTSSSNPTVTTGN
tara:strand:+ start:252 stop:779 length:528 start_codon:yes stop_codon:yes gene_type:complete